MSAALRTSIGRFMTRRTGQTLLPAIGVQIQQSNGIRCKAQRDADGITRLPPYDYINKDYGLLASLWDTTTKRLDENSKVSFIQHRCYGWYNQN